MRNVKLDNTQLNNLLMFLSRVEIKGSEAYELVKLMEMVRNAEIIKTEVPKSKLNREGGDKDGEHK